jgi:hypothetical protein
MWIHDLHKETRIFHYGYNKNNMHLKNVKRQKIHNSNILKQPVHIVQRTMLATSVEHPVKHIAALSYTLYNLKEISTCYAENLHILVPVFFMPDMA